MSARATRDPLIRRRRQAGGLKIAAVLTLGPGLVCLALYTLAVADQRLASAAGVNAFQQAREAALTQTPAQTLLDQTASDQALPDQTLWSAARRAAYHRARLTPAGTPAALLRISSIDLLVPVFQGTSDRVLNRGIGWIEGTAAPGDGGNVGLAGHRDGFFRRLRNLRIGDSLEIQTLEGSFEYRVTRITVVEPTDVHVLDPTEEPSVTLVTCYPFYFVGSAPQRFIVRGVLDDRSIQVMGDRNSAVRRRE